MPLEEKKGDPMDDLISRQAAIEVAEDAEMLWLKGEIDFIYPKVIKGLRSLPTIEERKKGKWEERKVFDTEGTGIVEMQSAKCSVCGKYHTTPYLYYFDNFNFCPNCGADMRGEKNDEGRGDRRF